MSAYFWFLVVRLTVVRAVYAYPAASIAVFAVLGMVATYFVGRAS